MKVVIVAKTRMGRGACIGGLTFDGRSVRLIPPDKDSDSPFNLEYNVGDVWEVAYTPEQPLIPPHVENIVVQSKRPLPPIEDIMPFIQRQMPPRVGGIEQLYDGLTQTTPGGTLYIAKNSGIPAYSTQFWQPDKPLQRDESAKRIHYRYPTEAGGCTLTFVGFQEPLAEIPAGAILRVSLAHWWRPPERPTDEPRCYVQLSGWFFPPTQSQPLTSSPSLPMKDPHPALTPFSAQPHTLLKQFFGFDTFRPMQADIVQRVLDKQDSLAVMPTGSGKSLCYQLPALLFSGLTVVVSPLISLMEDQVMQLREVGITAVYLNSSLSYQEYLQTMAYIRSGAVKLLYAAPETLLRPETLVLLEQIPVDCLTIDEAHCISEWGHDFRPEYRQLVAVRRRLPHAVCLAVTATATKRVQQDIKTSLAIGEAHEFIASFNRDNLFLAVAPRTDGLTQTIAFLEGHQGESGIIYCTTRRQVDTLTAALARRGWPVLPYHAGLDDATRRRHQQQFSRDDVPIMVATIAFGMGINKSNVRFILHYDLPKNLESYYQQIGRAGRDGLRADCLLLYSYADVQTINHFIQEQDPRQQVAAQVRLEAMLGFVETNLCRRRPLLAYFGESVTIDNCELCDNCIMPASQLVDLTIPAQKFLSCVKRTGELFGITHIIDILRGSQAQKILFRGHDQLSTYNIGRDLSKKVWQHLARQLIQQGLLIQEMDHGSLKLTPQAYAIFKGQVVMGSLLEQQQGVTAVTPTYDTDLFDLLRAKRKELANQENMPPYIIFADRTLMEMATYYPQSGAALATLYGVGEAKLTKYAAHFLPLMQSYCVQHSLAEKPKTAVAPSPPSTNRTADIVALFNKGQTLADIAQLYTIKPNTVLNHLWQAAQAGETLPPANLLVLSQLSPGEQQRVLAAFAELGLQRLRPVYEMLGENVSYDELHLLRLHLALQKADTILPAATLQSEISQQVLACVHSIPGQLPRSGIAKLLIGSNSERVAAYTDHPDYGRLAHLPRYAIMQVIDTLLATGELMLNEQRKINPG